MTTLYQRRIRGDLIETYKVLTGKVNVASDNFFSLHTGSYNTRGHSLKFLVQRPRFDLRKNFFQPPPVLRFFGRYLAWAPARYSWSIMTGSLGMSIVLRKGGFVRSWPAAGLPAHSCRGRPRVCRLRGARAGLGPGLGTGTR